MSIIDQAESDLEFILEDSEDGFGTPFNIIAPDGRNDILNGQSTDIGFLIDPLTGVGVRGRTAEVNFRLSSILLSFGEIPAKTETGEPWKFQVENVNGDEWEFVIEQADVDRKLGIIKIILGLHETESDS